MDFVRAEWRDWCAVMAGDRVSAGHHGRPWRVLRAEVEGDLGRGAGVLWLELEGVGRNAAVERRVMRVDSPGRARRARMAEGPGWDLGAVSSTGDEALRWALGLVAEVLGGSLLDTPRAVEEEECGRS